MTKPHELDAPRERQNLAMTLLSIEGMLAAFPDDHPSEVKAMPFCRAEWANLLACIREQQAALDLIREDCKRCVGLHMQTVIKERLIRITERSSAVLAKWPLS